MNTPVHVCPYYDAACNELPMKCDFCPERASTASAITDDFRGSTEQLIASITALIKLDSAGALVPHGIGGHARKLLAAAAVRLAAPTAQPEIPAVSRESISALRWLLNMTTEFDRKDVRTRQAARLLDDYTVEGRTNREWLEDLWRVLDPKMGAFHVAAEPTAGNDRQLTDGSAATIAPTTQPAAKQAEEICGRCGGSGDQEYLVGGGPDAHDEIGPCSGCRGSGVAAVEPSQPVRKPAAYDNTP